MGSGFETEWSALFRKTKISQISRYLARPIMFSSSLGRSACIVPETPASKDPERLVILCINTRKAAFRKAFHFPENIRRRRKEDVAERHGRAQRQAVGAAHGHPGAPHPLLAPPFLHTPSTPPLARPMVTLWDAPARLTRVPSRRHCRCSV